MSSINPGINVQSVPVLPDKTAPSEKQSPHPEWSMNTLYLCTTGVRQEPLSAPDPVTGATCRFVTLSAGLGQKLVVWHAERIGATPMLPAIEPNTAQQRLLEWKITGVVPMLMPDGQTFRIVVTGWYLYGLDRPPDLTKGLPLGSAPTDTVSPSQPKIMPSDFKPVF